MSKFEKDLAKGHLYEAKSLNYLDYDDYKFMNGYFKEYDLEITKNGNKTTIEVKSDTQASYTGNLAIEYECSGKPSGINATKADFWIYFICYKDYDECYKIPTEELREIATKCKKVSGGDGNRSRMYLVKKSLVKNYLINFKNKKIITYNIQPTMADQKPMTYTQKIINHFKEDGKENYDLEQIEELINDFSRMEYEKRKEKTDEMPFGKYKFRKVKDVAGFDKQYLKWLIRQDMMTNYEDLKNEINKYI